LQKNGNLPQEQAQTSQKLKSFPKSGRKTGKLPPLGKKKKSRNHCSFRTFVGGDKRDRTADLLNAIQALSQLSYTPEQEEL
jgi:hypothetical protein